eukprot:GILK01012327.1.p1 GENE.GILK01012327.1~~GILK01012327.1.p1  ORF type:complete len:256 (+),score=14.24 GILK01012327.1:30-770(+)
MSTFLFSVLCLSIVLSLVQSENPFTRPGDVVWACDTYDRSVHLTFDDGPREYTEHVLDVLKQYNVKATFFLLGKNVVQRPATVRRMIDEGHLVGNHGWFHDNYTEYFNRDAAAAKQAIIDTEYAILNASGQRPYLFRPPYGALTKEMKSFLTERNYTIVMWSLGALDQFVLNQTIAIPLYMNTVPDSGAILVVHDWVAETSLRVNELLDVMQTDHSLVPWDRCVERKPNPPQSDSRPDITSTVRFI